MAGPSRSQVVLESGEEVRKRISKPHDIEGLVPSFKGRILLLIAALERKGYEPVVVDGGRTAEEAHANQVKGTGKDNSMHRWGAAADFADREMGWDDPKFFDDLGVEAKKLGLWWGGDWTKPDRPHVQACPATARAQNAIRLLKEDDTAGVDRIVSGYLFVK